VMIDANGSLTYAPTSGYVGVDTFTYKVADENFESEPATVTVLVANTAPTASDDAYSTSVDTTKVVDVPGVLANDIDVNGDPIRVRQVTGPSHGSLVLCEEGSFTCVPLPGYRGFDSFTYVATDGELDSSVRTVTISVGPATIENSDPGVTFARYFSAYGSAFSGGSYTYAYSRAPFVGTKLEARFYGNQVQWIGPKQPNYGKAKVYIDDVYKETVDCYQASGTLSTVIYDSGVLSTDGWHTITIEMVDGKNAASTNYVVVIDCFEVYGSAPRKAGTRTSETEGTYLGGWVKVSGNPTYTDSSYAYSYWTGARFFCNFTGTKVTWVGPKVYNYGRAAVYVDGGYKGTVSQYAPSTSTAFRARVWESATFTSGRHYLEIRPLATKEAASSGKVIVIDAIDVTP